MPAGLALGLADDCPDQASEPAEDQGEPDERLDRGILAHGLPGTAEPTLVIARRLALSHLDDADPQTDPSADRRAYPEPWASRLLAARRDLDRLDVAKRESCRASPWPLHAKAERVPRGIDYQSDNRLAFVFHQDSDFGSWY